MKKRQILWAIVFGSMLAIAGCGDDDSSGSGDGGSSGAGGSAGTGGSNGSTASSCEAFCGGTCIFGGVTPGGDFDTCVDTCRTQEPDFDDSCGDEATAYLNCLEANDCNFAAFDCFDEAEAWGGCL